MIGTPPCMNNKSDLGLGCGRFSDSQGGCGVADSRERMAQREKRGRYRRGEEKRGCLEAKM